MCRAWRAGCRGRMSDGKDVVRKTALEWVADPASLSRLVYDRYAEIQHKQIKRASASEYRVIGGLLKGIGALAVALLGAISAGKSFFLDSTFINSFLSYLTRFLTWASDSGVWVIVFMSMLLFIFSWGMTRYSLFKSTRDVNLGPMSFVNGQPNRLTDDEVASALSNELIMIEKSSHDSMLLKYELPRMLVVASYMIVLAALVLQLVHDFYVR